MADAIRYDVDGAVATVTIDRPEAMNACDVAVRRGLREAFEQAGSDPGVRAVVLTGTGRAFCVGQDLKELEPLYASGSAALGGFVAEFNAAVRALRALPKPTIAAVNGAAAGAGLSFALACDFRIASERASFVTAFTKIGLVPDTGQSWTLPRLVGTTKAMELLAFSEPVSAPDALAMGLVTRVVPAESLAAAAASFAAELAAGPTVAYGYLRRLLDGSTGTLDESLALEDELQTAAGQTSDHQRAVASFLAKQQPTFEGR